MDKLIIHHGDRVTEHELADAPLTIGRDPECDLFFADKKLSRKHARVERLGRSYRLVDLESRNGSWVNEERIDARDLAPGDEIRLGGLRITIERESARDEDPGDESTVYLTGSPSESALADETRDRDAGTMMLAVADVEKPRSGDDSSTVFLSSSRTGVFTPLDEGDETLKKPEPEKTVVLPGQLPGKLYDTGTVVFRGKADPSLQEPATRLAPREAPLMPLEEVDLVEEEEQDASEQSFTASVTYVPDPGAGAGRAWALRFAPLAAALGAFALVVVALPLLRILSAALGEESSSRGRALVDLLAAANETALAEDRVQDVSVDRVASEPGVLRAQVLSPTGKVLAPNDDTGQASKVEGLSADVTHIRSFQESRDANGDRTLAQPIVHRGLRVGIAVVKHALAGRGAPLHRSTLGFASPRDGGCGGRTDRETDDGQPAQRPAPRSGRARRGARRSASGRTALQRALPARVEPQPGSCRAPRDFRSGVAGGPEVVRSEPALRARPPSCYACARCLPNRTTL